VHEDRTNRSSGWLVAKAQLKDHCMAEAENLSAATKVHVFFCYFAVVFANTRVQ
jgi:hypothetical protein